ncbi:aspartate kinase [Rubritalea squalenifaciens DSM 18772]|uniref:Aspartokinase n=1 Tax=Rubritalea squalenifaciens DSM 18772 TaxID=1123071 RepID=A0A1M6PET3_9BACT|nr:aspartate kinase [Rubritalea squalenifaciens]SHK06453.1 aspartate kinase [Rubritalea squalenifaciens DSM 18772]
MALIVQKYGGTSVGSLDRIRNVANRIKKLRDEGNQVVAVVSAMGGVTDKLIGMAKELTGEPAEREMDVLLSTGEQQSIALVTMALHELGVDAASVTGRQAGIRTTGSHTRGKIDSIDPTMMNQYLSEGKVVIVAGFQGLRNDDLIHTLGRGGSDLTAIAVASAVKADLCQILTDVDGVYTCDPRVVKDARKLPEISYDEMLEMASSGSKVMQSRSVEFAKKYGVIFEVRSSLNDNPGTIVTEEHDQMESVVIRGVSIERSQARLTITGIPDEPGMSARILGCLADAEINIDMIISNIAHDGMARHSFTMHSNDLGKAQAALKPVIATLPASKIETEAGIAKLSCVGIGMRSHSGVAAKMFEALGEAQINIGMITTSEIKIAVTVDETQIEDAARAVHTAFELDKVPSK